MKRQHITFLLVSLIALGITACIQPTASEKIVSFKDHTWQSAYKPWIDIDVKDTAGFYDIYAVVRHSDNFKYNNLILNYYFIALGDSAKMQRIVLPLGENNHWYGDTVESTIETRIKINKAPVKLPYGKNSFILQQLMPTTALKHILNIGISIEKSKANLTK